MHQFRALYSNERFHFIRKLSIRPTENDEIFFKPGFTAGNALSNFTPFSISSWAAAMEDDLKDIICHNRYSILAAQNKLH